MKVGMPMLMLYPDGTPAGDKKGKHRGNLLKVAQEAGNERYSKDQDLDRNLSMNNTYIGVNGIQSGKDANDYILGQVEACNARRRASGRRAVRSNAAVAFSLIIKPPAEEMIALTPAERERFFADSDEILGDIFSWYGTVETVLDAAHRDEPLDYLDNQPRDHHHKICIGYDKDGDLNIDKFVNPRVFRALNSDYPRMMQERGWEVEEISIYDPEAAKEMDEDERNAYKEECRAKRKSNSQKNGEDSNSFKSRKRAERIEKAAKEEAAHIMSEAEREASAKRKEAEKDRGHAALLLQQAKAAVELLEPILGTDWKKTRASP